MINKLGFGFLHKKVTLPHFDYSILYFIDKLK